MLEGLYTVKFASNLGGAGGGVVVLRNGKLAGGDSGFYYTGQVREDAGRLRADLRVVRHTQGNQSIFGPAEEFGLQLEGVANGTSVVLDGHVVEQPSARMQALLTHRGAL